MAKELIWSSEDEYVYGRKVEFLGKEDFANTVKDQYEDGECSVTDITIEPCIYSERTIPGDHLVPLSLADYTIENYYMAKIIPVNNECPKCGAALDYWDGKASCPIDSCNYERPMTDEELED